MLECEKEILEDEYKSKIDTKNFIIAIESVAIAVLLIIIAFSWLSTTMDWNRSLIVRGYCSYMDEGNITINRVTYPVGNVFLSMIPDYVNRTIEVEFDYKDGMYYFSTVKQI